MLMDFSYLVKKYNLEIEGVIHIGAHDGGEYFEYQKHGIKNMMFFEPIPHIFDRLKNNIGEDNAVLFEMALGNKTGRAIIYFGTDGINDSCSSMLEPDTFLRQYPNFNFSQMFEVSIDKLDNIEFNRDEYNFINIDVQGYELEVFKGAVNSLNDVDYIMSEVNSEHLYRDCVLVDELDSFLSDFGFMRVETLWKNKGWGDALYIKNNLL